jgi:ElaB/YqjD/DUF883 family membrane-anchored ribosome-binding protein
MSIELVTRVVTESREAAEKLRDKIEAVIQEAEEKIHEVAHEISERLPGLHDDAERILDEAKGTVDQVSQDAANVAANVENRTSGVTTDVTAPGGVEGLSGPQEPVNVEGTVSSNAPATEGSLAAEGSPSA